MKLNKYISFPLTEEEEKLFLYEVTVNNINRGKFFCKYVIVFEIILAILDVYSSLIIDRQDFHFLGYLSMYLIMVIVNAVFLMYLHKIKLPIINVYKTKKFILMYVIFVMCWGAVISLMDQKLYGQVIVYIINAITCSVIYYLDNKDICYSYFISVLVLFIGLPYAQPSKDILIGHGVNLVIFIFHSWLASRILYRSLYNDFKSKRKFQELSLRDELTGMPNRRSLREFIEFAWKYNLKEKSSISVLMIDVDFFKQYNDNYGHIEGDKVLKEIGKILKEALRDNKDFTARYGGEEFIFIALNTENNEIYGLAEEIRKRVDCLKIPHKYSEIYENITVSIGASTVIPYSEKAIYDCINNADNALYEAKEKGKNRVESFMDIA